ncbi:MAG: VWA domain-containing protein, partial [Gammaproteobacteria bacterium]
MPEFAQAAWFWLLPALPLVVYLRLRARVAEPPLKRAAGVVLRCLSLVLLVVALAGPLEDTYSTHTDIVFVLDVSHSVDHDTARDALAFINRALVAKDPGARVGLVAFGADAAVERLLNRSEGEIDEISVQVARGGTDIARAIELAVGTFQTEGQRRVVLLSDGQENLGRARSAAAVARSVGVAIDAVAFVDSESRDEILIRDLVAPAWVRAHEPFELSVTLSSQTIARTHLVITRNGSPFDDVTLTLEPGLNSYSFVDKAAAPGLHEYEAIVNSDRDNVQENNRYQTFVQVAGAPRVLHAFGDPDGRQYVTSALRAQGLVVAELAGTALPVNMHELVEYDLVILNNVSGLDMSLAKMQLLEDYVRDAGGGLIKLGGDKSYGAGGYHGTPIERALPVTMDI